MADGMALPISMSKYRRMALHDEIKRIKKYRCMALHDGKNAQKLSLHGFAR